MKAWIAAPSATFIMALLGIPLAALAQETRAPFPGGRWFVNAGVSVRALHTSFDFAPPSDEGWRNFFGLPTRGDPGLFTGGTQPVIYDNGIVGGANPVFADFGALGQVDSIDQISASSSRSNPNGNLARPVAFESIHFEGTESVQSSWMQGNGTGPSLQLVYRLGKSMGTTFEVQTGWSFILAESAPDALKVFGVDQVTSAFLYDFIANPAFPLAIPGDVDGLNHFLVYDPEALPPFFGAGFEGPRRGRLERRGPARCGGGQFCGARHPAC